MPGIQLMKTQAPLPQEFLKGPLKLSQCDFIDNLGGIGERGDPLPNAPELTAST